MWSCAPAVVLFVFSLGATAQDDPQPSPASLYSEPEPLPNTSPLAQLLASATGTRSLVFPAISGQRKKRKPFQFKHRGHSRFRPKSFRNKNQETIGKLKSEIQAQTTLEPRFSGFLPRPGPEKQTHIDKSNNSGKDQSSSPVDKTTKQPLKLTDFFGTPEPIVTQTRAATIGQVSTTSNLHNPIPFAISSENAFSDQQALFKRLQSITGAQPVMVTKDIAGVGELGVNNRKVGNRVRQPMNGETIVDPAIISGETSQVTVVGAETREEQMIIRKPSGDQVLNLETSGIQMLLEQPKEDEVLNGEIREYPGRKQKQRRRGKAGGKGRAVHRRKPKEELENDGRKGKQLSFVKAPRSPRQKKSNWVRKKRNKARVVTVDQYRYENKDGSITWGYKNDDGGFKEETIGMDCITRGKYGYTDSYGEKREYSYSSGLRCHPQTRKVAESDPNQSRGPNDIGFYDYSQNKFVMPNGRRVTVVVNEGNKARGRRY